MVLHALLQVSLCGQEESEAMSGYGFFLSSFEVVREYHVYKKVWTPVLGEHAPYAHYSNIPPIY